MARHLYLLVFPIRASKINGTRSHWAIFIPGIVETSIGKLIQVLGTPFTGYGLEFRRNYNISTIAETFEKPLLGEVDKNWIEKGEEENHKASTDVNPRDEIERLAKRIEVPGVSREPLNPLVIRMKGHAAVMVADFESRVEDVRSGRENLSSFSLGKELSMRELLECWIE
jgi:hypothetical protein